MTPPSTRVQVLAVWTTVCGAAAVPLAIAASNPAECFECGLGSWLAGVVLAFLAVVWLLGVALVLAFVRRSPE